MTETTQQETNLKVIIERLKNFQEKNDEDHERLILQITKTNGSVAEIKKWQERTIGALTILSLIVLPVVVSVITRFVIINLFP